MTVSQVVDPIIEASWKEVLAEDFNSESFRLLRQFLKEEKRSQEVFPPGHLIFEAFNRTPFDKVKVVIIGQDPYHGRGQAHGLSFSVPAGVRPPPSLVNIFKELKEDLGLSIPAHGNLSPWADEGVLLLNATLTVRSGIAGSHQGKGWEEFTNNIIAKLSAGREHLVFLLWGKFAQEKIELIEKSRHCVLTAAHPSPFSANNGFFGCRHFSRANAYLVSNGITPVNWTLPD